MRKAFIQNSLKKIAGKHYLIVGAAILIITVTHFVLQVSFIQTEILQAVENSVKNIKISKPGVDDEEEVYNAQGNGETYQPEKVIEPKTEKVNEPARPKTVPPVVRRQADAAPQPARVLPRKKVNRESRAARLRRAEKILTGV